MGRQQPLLLEMFLDLHQRPLSLMWCQQPLTLLGIFWWSVTSGRSPGTVDYSAICDPTPSGFHTSGLPTFDFGTSANLTRCPNDEFVEIRQTTLGSLLASTAPEILRPVKLSLRNLSQLGVILTVLLAELLELLQHLAQLGFKSFGRQSGLARLYQHALKQLCGFSEYLLRLSVISKLGMTIFTLSISISTFVRLLLAVLFSRGFLGPNPWLFVHGFSGPNPWLFDFLHGRLARVSYNLRV